MIEKVRRLPIEIRTKPGIDSPLPPGATEESVRKQVEKILASRIFLKSERLTHFLRFTVDQALLSRQGSTKEYLLGLEVFGKQADYDPRTDPIVRVEARRLRRKLDEYYATEGLRDPLLIEYPKGGYLPVFRYHTDCAGLIEDPLAGCPEWHSIAVLPFVDRTAQRDQEPFCDGLTEELIAALASTEGVRVVASTSVFQYKGRAEDIRKIGRELGSALVLEGRVRRSGPMLRISLQLIDAEDGLHLWAASYDRPLPGEFALEVELAQVIVHELTEKLTLSAPRPLQ